jgi:hypothetical protein
MSTSHSTHKELVARLSKYSVEKHYDAYEDVAWDRPEHRIEPDDPRWEASEEDPLGSTDWYRSLPQEQRARFGLENIAHQMSVGMIFESVLSRGLLAFTTRLSDRAPELRYAYHEVIEESQHSLMFREFVDRSGADFTQLGPLEMLSANRIPNLGRRFPELFFLFVLGGEVPIDGVQKRALDKRNDLHPLLRRIMQIHVTEEARHLSFARSYLREHVPKLGFARMTILRVATPLILAGMTRDMLDLPAKLIRKYSVPREVQKIVARKKALGDRIELLEPIRALAFELGIATPATIPAWRRLGLWPQKTQ